MPTPPEPTSRPTPTPTPSPTPEPRPEPTAEGEELDRPAIPIVGNAIPRVRTVLANIAATPRERMTLVFILIAVGATAIIAFAYLILRRR